MKKDIVFKNNLPKASDFKFDKNVVNVFDDMVVRSVPCYLEMQRMIVELADEYAISGTTIYDLGCSTGTTLMNLHSRITKEVKFVGIDDSKEMLDKCRKNLLKSGLGKKFELVCADLNKGVQMDNASVVVLCLTLQFVRPLYRLKLLQQIQASLVPGGCVIIIEKILGEQPDLNRNFIKYYYDFKKRNKYSELEISQKREALENVLIPYKLSENVEMLLTASYSSSEVFFKWYNFAGIVAFK